jgi:hypothetical protein
MATPSQAECCLILIFAAKEKTVFSLAANICLIYQAFDFKLSPVL